MRALLLLSGGIDSPVAAHLLRERGFHLDAVHFSLEPFTDDAAEQKACDAAAHLGFREVTVVPAGPLFAEIPKKARHALYFVLSKRFMIRVADRMGAARGIPFLATGENLGQVSSQTLRHLAAIDRAATRPILRPLLAFDKGEIVDLAREIGTFEISKGPEVCDILGPAHPATSAKLDEVDEEEAKLDAEAMAGEALRTARVRRVGPLTAA